MPYLFFNHNNAPNGGGQVGNGREPAPLFSRYFRVLFVFWFLPVRLGQDRPRSFYRAHAFPRDCPYFLFLVELGPDFDFPLRHSAYATLETEGGRMLKSIGLPELLVILVVALLLFGGKKIPEVAKGLGEGIRNFKSSLKGEDEHPDDKKPA